jgi:hypothetical protein
MRILQQKTGFNAPSASYGAMNRAHLTLEVASIIVWIVITIIAK